MGEPTGATTKGLEFRLSMERERNAELACALRWWQIYSQLYDRVMARGDDPSDLEIEQLHAARLAAAEKTKEALRVWSDEPGGVAG